MGAAAARRARDLFAPEVVMAAHEELFVELEQCRRQAPADAHCPRPVSPQLDPVRVFARFASHPPTAIQPTASSCRICRSVRQAAGCALANSGAIAAGFRAQSLGERPWFANINSNGVLIKWLSHDPALVLDPPAPPC